VNRFLTEEIMLAFRVWNHGFVGPIIYQKQYIRLWYSAGPLLRSHSFVRSRGRGFGRSISPCMSSKISSI
jgi:hypothetical protein